MKKFLNIFFINENGKISWTTIGALHALILFWTIYIQLFVFGNELTAAVIQFAIESMILFFGARPLQRGFQYMGKGIAKVGKKGANIEAAKEVDQVEKDQEIVSDLSTKIGYFSPIDFASQGETSMPIAIYSNVLLLIDNLNVLRTELGVPIIVTSGYRTVAHNKAVGGAENSQHLHGQAADIQAKGRSPQEVAATIERLMDERRMEVGGIGLYKSFVHYDRRGQKLKWDER